MATFSHNFSIAGNTVSGTSTLTSGDEDNYLRSITGYYSGGGSSTQSDYAYYALNSGVYGSFAFPEAVFAVEKDMKCW